MRGSQSPVVPPPVPPVVLWYSCERSCSLVPPGIMPFTLSFIWQRQQQGGREGEGGRARVGGRGRVQVGSSLQGLQSCTAAEWSCKRVMPIPEATPPLAAKSPDRSPACLPRRPCARRPPSGPRRRRPWWRRQSRCRRRRCLRAARTAWTQRPKGRAVSSALHGQGLNVVPAEPCSGLCTGRQGRPGSDPHPPVMALGPVVFSWCSSLR